VIVDGISGLGAMPFETDAWGIDLVVSASQKAWMASPGIGLAVVSERARAAEESARMPRYYFDFAEARRWAEKGQTPWTPAVAVLFGLRAGVRRLVAEGRETTWARHESVAAGARAGLEALGFRLVAPEGHRSPTVTAAWLPDGLEWGPFNAEMRRRGLVVAGGQGRLAGRILRFGHMGMVEAEDLAEAIRVMGEVLRDGGTTVEPIAAAEATRSATRESLAASAPTTAAR
jgi:aspartate aminotransferase-like enzyme